MRNLMICRNIASRSFKRSAQVKVKERDGCTIKFCGSKLHKGVKNIDVDCETYATLLQDYISVKALAEGKKVHAQIIKREYESDIFLQNQLVNLYAKCEKMVEANQLFDKMPIRNVFSWNNMISGYAKCGSIECARDVFDRMPERDVVSWNSMIAGYALHGHGEEALKLYCQMAEAGTMPERITFLSVLGVCTSLAAVERVHTHTIKTGYQSNPFVGSALVDIYAKCGSIKSARQVFNKVTKRDEVLWNGMIVGYVIHGQSEEAFKLIGEMQRADIKLNHFPLASLLKACASVSDLEHGKQVHGFITRIGFASNVFLGNALVDMYAKCGNVEDARQVFDKMLDRNVVSWNAMVAGYAKCGSILHARHLFDKMPKQEVVSWNAIIAGHSQHGQGEEALKLFCLMQRDGMKPDRITFAIVLGACATLVASRHGKQVHAQILKVGFESSVFVGSSLVDMYAQCSLIEDGHQVFEKLGKRDVVLWNAMIAGYDHNGLGKKAFKLFCQMQTTGMKLDHFTFASMLSACASLPDLPQGKQVHAHAIRTGYESNVFVGTALVDMYCKCGRTNSAWKLFENMPKRNLVSWNTMSAGFVQNGHGEEALEFFCQMLSSGVEQDQFTFATVLSACASIAAMQQGKQVHTHTIISGFHSHVSVGNALITMYAKSGSIEDACHVFNKMPEWDVVSWTAVIAGYAQHGYGHEALQLFEQMQHAGMKPDQITYIGILSACSHAGLVDEGRLYFDSMYQNHCITPNADHYACMIDLLGRAGHLDEAEEIIKNMPFEPDAVVWGALLGACRIHGNMELGKHAAECLLALEPQNSATYVLLSNIYAAAGRWDDVASVRKSMKVRDVKKKPGCSWIEVKNRVHAFLVEDRSHPQTEEIYAMLERLAEQMVEAGYVPDTNFVLHDVEEE
eukprot:Gb_30732 [translate_table: standard]